MVARSLPRSSRMPCFRAKVRAKHVTVLAAKVKNQIYSSWYLHVDKYYSAGQLLMYDRVNRMSGT